MTMKKISIDEMKKIAKEYRLFPCKISGTSVVAIRKRRKDKYIDIDWPEFESILKKRKLAIYKATESDFVKIMKDKV